MAPVILALKKTPGIDCKVLVTAQHREMLDQILQVFKIKPDIDLDIMRPNQTLTSLTATLLSELDKVMLENEPVAVLAQGDTTTVMSVAMTCFYHRIPFGHVEAGLRTWDMSNPFPEEMNRVVAGKLARWHFAPTQGARHNLLREGIAEHSIFVTGNTVIDALMSVTQRDIQLPFDLDPGKRLILVTAHRRENFGEPFKNICRALLALAEQNRDIQILYPVHPNPNVKETAHDILGHHPQIILCKPLDYLFFVEAMKRSFIIVSDSGGVQEEAPALGKPVLVLRHETERPEAVEEGVVKLIGTVFDTVVNSVQQLLDNEDIYQKMACGASPYGDGKAAGRISQILLDHFSSCA
jgi:UDP-N-acetylglucosamine 2-epimerase (non-hydrolysing)